MTGHPAGWHVVRVTLQALSPLSCASGIGELSDVALVRDANGLPMIPGATLQGLLKRFCPDDCRNDLFGREDEKDEKDEKDTIPAKLMFGKITPSSSSARTRKETIPAKLIFSNALVHDSCDQAVRFPDKLTDPLLTRLIDELPLKRDHVRLDHRHGAAHAGKFDRAAVPKGTRFSFELLARSPEVTKDHLEAALSGLADPLLRIGGSGSKGYGKVELIACRHRRFGADEWVQLRDFRRTQLASKDGMTELTPSPAPAALTIGLTLAPVQPWRSGQDRTEHARWAAGSKHPKWTDASPRESAADLLPLREPEICRTEAGKLEWREPGPDNADGYVLPGSGVRGPLLHRTLFHWCRLAEEWAGKGDAGETLKKARHKLEPLFGFVADGKPEDGRAAQASPLIVEDVRLTVRAVVPIEHIRIDRFTGGVVQGALYSQELIETATLAVALHIDAKKLSLIDDALRTAFVAALRDLAEGRLALGAKSLGFCKLPESVEPEFSGADEDVWRSAWDDAAFRSVREVA